MMKTTLTFCHDSSLPDCLELSSWIGLESSIQHESNNKKIFNTTTTTESAYDTWRFSHIYKDKGLPLETGELLSLSHGCMSATLPLVETAPMPYLPRCKAANVEIQDLDVTAPAIDCCNKLAGDGNTLVSQLQTSGHMLLGLNALQVIIIFSSPSDFSFI